MVHYATSRTGTSVEVPEDFICPITLQVMVSPLMTRTGLTFERSAILGWLGRGTGQCPLTRNPMRPSDLIPHRSLETRIRNWREDHDIPEPSRDELEETKCDFYGFLKVGEDKTKEIMSLASAARHSASSSRSSSSSSSSRRRSTAVTLNSILSNAPVISDDESGEEETSSSPTSSPAQSQTMSRQQQQRQKRRFRLSRILNAVSRELDDDME